MRTACFVDGYNLFYGLLAGTGYKWLDLPKLLEHVIRVQDPSNELVSVHYFTSMVKPDLARLGKVSSEAQHSYMRALKARGVLITEGRHRLEPGLAPKYVEGQKASRSNQSKIWLLEEKETDVNVALSMYRCAAKQQQIPLEDRIEQIVLVSADTDMAPALKALKEDFPEVRRGVILPHREGIQRDAPGSLKNEADWMRKTIKESELADCLLPRRVPTKKKPADMPVYWNRWPTIDKAIEES